MILPVCVPFPTQYGETLLATLAHHTVMGSDVASSGDSDTGTLFDGMRALISAGACTQSVVIDLDTNEVGLHSKICGMYHTS